MTRTVVLDNVSASEIVGPNNTPKMAYENLLSSATTVPASATMLYDGMTGIKYTAATATIELEFVWSTTQSIGYGGVAGASFGTFATTIEVYTWNGSSYDLANDISGLRDNQPAFLTFDEVTTSKVKFKFISNAAGLTIGELGAGATIDFPRPVSTGYRPGQWTSKDLVTSGMNQANTFGRSTVIQRGTEESIPIKNIGYEWMNTNWSSFIRNAQGRQVWFAWNPTGNPADVIYGNWKANNPSYVSSLYSDLTLTIMGQA